MYLHRHKIVYVLHLHASDINCTSFFCAAPATHLSPNHSMIQKLLWFAPFPRDTYPIGFHEKFVLSPHCQWLQWLRWSGPARRDFHPIAFECVHGALSANSQVGRICGNTMHRALHSWGRSGRRSIEQTIRPTRNNEMQREPWSQRVWDERCICGRDSIKLWNRMNSMPGSTEHLCPASRSWRSLNTISLKTAIVALLMKYQSHQTATSNWKSRHIDGWSTSSSTARVWHL